MTLIKSSDTLGQIEKQTIWHDYIWQESILICNIDMKITSNFKFSSYYLLLPVFVVTLTILLKIHKISVQISKLKKNK